MKASKLAVLALAGIMAVGVAGCGSSGSGDAGKAASSKLSGTVTASGSSALLPLAKAAADQFKAKNPDVSVTVNGGGSGTGLKQVSDGTVNIGNSDVFAAEKLDKDKAGQLVDHKVAIVTMATVANKAVTDKVKSLTKAQLKDIFSGKVTNWNQVGGPDEKIVLVTRPSTSGTRALFTQYALEGANEAENKALETDDSGTLMQSIGDNKGAIGYVALSYVGKNANVGTIALDGVDPTLENTYSGKYPVWGYEHMYTKGDPKDAVKAFLDYIMSDEFGKEVEKMGYGIASKMKVTRDK